MMKRTSSAVNSMRSAFLSASVTPVQTNEMVVRDQNSLSA